MKQYKEGDKILVSIGGVSYNGHIEKRMIGQWPQNKSFLYVVLDSRKAFFPIEVTDFVKNYGTIKKNKSMSKIKEYKGYRITLKCGLFWTLGIGYTSLAKAKKAIDLLY